MIGRDLIHNREIHVGCYRSVRSVLLFRDRLRKKLQITRQTYTVGVLFESAFSASRVLGAQYCIVYNNIYSGVDTLLCTVLFREYQNTPLHASNYVHTNTHIYMGLACKCVDVRVSVLSGRD